MGEGGREVGRMGEGRSAACKAAALFAFGIRFFLLSTVINFV